MKRLILFAVFCILYSLRWTLLSAPLPKSWTPTSVVKFTAPIIDQVEHTDTKTIVRCGIWYVPLKGYAEIIPGDVVAFSGTATPQVLLSKVTRIVMEDPTFEVVQRRSTRRLSLTEMALLGLLTWREHSVGLLEKWLPEPMSSLAAGILLGVKGQMPDQFYQQLVTTGTLHIIAASGYNVSIVAELMMRILSSWFSRGIAIAGGVLTIVLYVLVAGSGASVVRAGIMGSLTLIAYYFGRPAEARRLLWVAAAIMLLVNPLMLFDVGFQLSVTATAGLLYIEPWIRGLLRWVPAFLSEYLVPTLAATLATAPVILWHFGRVSWISPLVNVLVLPLVPLMMGMTALVLGLGTLIPVLGQVMAWLLYVPLSYMIWVIRWFGG